MAVEQDVQLLSDRVRALEARLRVLEELRLRIREVNS